MTLPGPHERILRYRAQHWTAVEQQLSRLEHQLLTPAIALWHTLSTWQSPDAQFRHLLSELHDLPTLNLPVWMAADWGGPEAVDDPEVEALVVALVLLVLRTNAAWIAAEPRFSLVIPPQLIVELRELGLRCLAPIPAFQSLLPAYEDCRYEAAFHTPATLVVSAQLAAAVLDHIPDAGQWAQLLEGLVAAHRLADDLLSIQASLTAGHLTAGGRALLQTAGLDPDAPLDPVRALGAIVFTGAAGTLVERTAVARAACRAAAEQLGLPSVAAHISAVEGHLAQLAQGLSLRGARTAATLGFLPAVDTLGFVITMAEAYLLHDLRFVEAWEVQRQQICGRDEVVSRPFPVGSVIELLCAEGHQLGPQIDGLAQELAQQRFRYFDCADPTAPDSDDLGLLLRLTRWAANPEAVRAIAEQPLQWMLAHLGDAARPPIWFPDPDLPTTELLWGDDCLTTQANLLLGLLALDEPALRPVIERCGAQVLRDWLRRGFAGSHYYGPHYSVWVLSRLAAALRQDDDAALATAAADSLALLTEQWALLAKAADPTPQQAALLVLTSAVLDQHPAAGWQLLLVKTQRYDGAWEVEPGYITSGRFGGAAWYSSRTFTTALCYAALKTYARYRS